MADTNPEAKKAAPEPFSIASIAFDTWKAKKPSIFLMIPEEFVVGLGMVAVIWGEFEMAFDDLIAALVKTSAANVYPVWKILSFRKRRKLAAREINRLFADHVEIKRYLTTILADSERLQRNARSVLRHCASGG